MDVRVLLADDNEVMRETLRDVLADAGDRVVGQAATGPETLRAARERRPEVVVLDVGMPGSGPDLVRGLGALAEPPRVLVFSALDDADTVVAMLGAGATAYVVKGSLDGDFPACVSRCARGRRFVRAACAAEVHRRMGADWAVPGPRAVSRPGSRSTAGGAAGASPGSARP